MSPVDRFSGHADLYQQYRIDYPAELYNYLLSFVTNRQRAWDCATGNGQVAVILADYFAEVEATDISQAQLSKAVQRPNIRYQVTPAEHTPFPDQHFDLITVAQALHWFDVEAFHQEVIRVAKPGAIVAEWMYGVALVDASLDALIQDFYRNRVGPYWDPQRRHIDENYVNLPFPFADVQQRQFTIHRHWTAERFLNYLRTWSAVQNYIRQHQNDPVKYLAEELSGVWGEEEKDVKFPVVLRVGRL
ncbi:class I SAM-dependent methyltransferase [Nibrella saemangeumensis]|uniref:Class I SAM-dependent methyltransferase n=1 Tax=Nibrella saemangeumensis TaxID=1084526 RepID=A0ABP8MAW8_9BACT